MQEKDVNNPVITEDNAVAKVAELLATLDNVKKYNALTKSLRRFALIVFGSILIFLAVGASMGLLNLVATLDKPQIVVTSVLWLLIPIGGIISGIVFIRRRVNAVKTNQGNGTIVLVRSKMSE